MNKAHALGLAALAILVAACSSTPQQPEAPAAGPDLTGNWVVTTESRMGAHDSDMTVKQTGSALAGTLISQMGSVNYTGSIEGSVVEFGFDLDIRGNSLRIDYSGVVEGDSMKGKAVFGPFGEGSFTAKRKAP